MRNVNAIWISAENVVSLSQKGGESPKHAGSLLFWDQKNGCFTSEVKKIPSERGIFFSESGFFLGVCARNFEDIEIQKLKYIYFPGRIFNSSRLEYGVT